jgi:hypothetical protein
MSNEKGREKKNLPALSGVDKCMPAQGGGYLLAARTSPCQAATPHARCALVAAHRCLNATSRNSTFMRFKDYQQHDARDLYTG